MNYADYHHVIQQAQFGYAYHKIILDKSGKPYDYRFLETNQAFESLTGLKSSEIAEKTVREVLPGIEKSEFNWIDYYGNIALHGGTGTFEQYNEPLGRWYNVKVYSPEKLFFTTIFVDVTNQHELAEASGTLNGFTWKDIDYQYVTDRMVAFSGARYVVLNKFDANGTDFTSVAVSGLRKNVEKAIKMLGFQLKGKNWKYDPVREQKIRNSKTTFFDHLYDLTGTVISKDLINVLAHATGVGGAAIVKTVQDEKMVGDFTLVFEKDQHLSNQWLVESYADIVGMLLVRINAEEAMSRQKAELEDFFTVNLDLLSIADTSGSFIKVNKEWESILGYPIEEIQGRKFLDFVHPDDMAPTLVSLAKLTVQETVLNFVNRFQCKDGSYRFFEWRSYPRGSLIYSAARDITERKTAEESLRASEEKFAAAFRNAPVLIAITDLIDATYVEVNEQALLVSGFSREEVIGHTAVEIGWILTEDRPRMIKEIHDHGRIIDMEMVFHTKDGRILEGLVNGEQIILGGRACLLTMTVDITLRKQAERELVRAKEKAEESDRLKSAFLANMSHEIRTPMNGILGFTELLKEPKLTGEEQQKFVSIIEKSGNRLLNIINDIMSLSKMEAGQTEVSLSGTNINEQFEFLYTFFNPEATGKGIQLIVKNSLEESEIIVKTDKEKILAILTNLIKNALKFTQKGAIEFGCTIKGQWLEFFVIDSGAGISAEQKIFIFERFRQGTNSLNRNYEGAGLGLSISKGFIELLGGRIWVESEPGKGSTFYFTIPYIID